MRHSSCAPANHSAERAGPPRTASVEDVDGADDIARALQRLTADPLADAVSGAVIVVSVSEPAPKGRYQECRLELVTEAPGVAPATVTTSVVTRPKHWPRPGMRLPAQISASRPSIVDVDWDALAR